MKVIYEDNSILVVDKPSGIAVQTANISVKSLETECRKYRKSKGEKPEIYVVHRLDQPVSGIILFAKTKEAAAALSKDMKDENLLKDYRATVYTQGEIKEKNKLVNYIMKDSKSSKAVICDKESKEAKKAELDYEVISRDGVEVNVVVHLHTGRFHQIRAQLANIGAPIVGDLKYGTDESIDYSKSKGIKDVRLEAFHIVFRHPETGKLMEFEK